MLPAEMPVTTPPTRRLASQRRVGCCVGSARRSSRGMITINLMSCPITINFWPGCIAALLPAAGATTINFLCETSIAINFVWPP